MSDELELHGTCDNCLTAGFVLHKYKGREYCQFCLPYRKGKSKIKVDKIERPIEEFNKIIQRTK